MQVRPSAFLWLVIDLIPNGVRVVFILDTRQNPEKLREILKKDL